MDTLVGSLRGMGCSVVPMTASIVGVCGLRVLWIFTVFRFISPTLTTLYISYPVTWVVTALVHLVTFIVIRRRYPSQDLEDPVTSYRKETA